MEARSVICAAQSSKMSITLAPSVHVVLALMAPHDSFFAQFFLFDVLTPSIEYLFKLSFAIWPACY